MAKKVTYVMVDVEADGPAPGLYSMIELGAVIVEPTLNRTFYTNLKPISDEYVYDALAVTGHSREETMKFKDPCDAMLEFDQWLSEQIPNGKIIFVSDNNGFDWQFVNYYFHKFLLKNPFGHSSMNLGSLYKGMQKSMFENFKHLRKTKHTHNPVDDAKGNAEAMLTILENFKGQ